MYCTSDHGRVQYHFFFLFFEKICLEEFLDKLQPVKAEIFEIEAENY